MKTLKIGSGVFKVLVLAFTLWFPGEKLFADTVYLSLSGAPDKPVLNRVLICELAFYISDKGEPTSLNQVTFLTFDRQSKTLRFETKDFDLPPQNQTRIQWFPPEERRAFFNSVLRKTDIRAEVLKRDDTRIVLWLPQLRRARPVAPPGLQWTSGLECYQLPEWDYLPLTVTENGKTGNRQFSFKDIREVFITFDQPAGNIKTQIHLADNSRVDGWLERIPYRPDELGEYNLNYDLLLWGLTEEQKPLEIRRGINLVTGERPDLTGAMEIPLRNIKSIVFLMPENSS